jgi:hypothetical protein
MGAGLWYSRIYRAMPPESGTLLQHGIPPLRERAGIGIRPQPLTIDIRTFARTLDDPAPGTGREMSHTPDYFLRR